MAKIKYRAGDSVAVRRATGLPWERATYLSRAKQANARGWHLVELMPGTTGPSQLQVPATRIARVITPPAHQVPGPAPRPSTVPS
jgi:hypothetical protein